MPHARELALGFAWMLFGCSTSPASGSSTSATAVATSASTGVATTGTTASSAAGTSGSTSAAAASTASTTSGQSSSSSTAASGSSGATTSGSTAGTTSGSTGTTGAQGSTGGATAGTTSGSSTSGGSSGGGRQIYLANTASGTADGSSCANAYAVSWFNDAANWGSGAGLINAGATVHLCGTFTGSAGSTELTFQGGGAAGAPVTLLFEPGAVLTAPYWAAAGAIALGSNSHVVVNGGTNGLIEATANGTGLANSVGATEGVAGNQSGNTATDITVENLSIQNLYVHTCTLPIANCTDESGQDSYGIAVYFSSDVLIQNNTVTNTKWAIAYAFEGADFSNVTISNNTLAYVDHGVFVTGGSSGTFDTLAIEGNHVTHMEVWDDADDDNHHDCYHVNSAAGASFNGVTLSNNTCITDPGANGNTCIFSFPDPSSEGPLTIFNNVCDSSLSTTNFFADGDINITNVSGNFILNNTFVHPNVSVNGGTQPCGVGLRATGDTVLNNVFVYAALPEDFYVMESSPASSIDFNDFFGLPNNGGFEMPTGTYYATLPSWTSSTTYDANSILGNPTLSAAYVPQAGSAVVDAGVNLTSLGIAALLLDAAGNPRLDGGAWTMGAFNPD
jgi:hypothetical protein